MKAALPCAEKIATTPVASFTTDSTVPSVHGEFAFTKEVNLGLAKRPLKTNGRLAYRGLTSLSFSKKRPQWSL